MFLISSLFHRIATYSILLASTIAALGADRVALVIGNGGYEHASKLPNATGDSTAVAGMLKKAGFTVISSSSGISDASTVQFYSALEKFKDAASGAKVGLVYYAGHGVEVDGRNYLLPVDAKLESSAELRTQAVPLDAILADMKEARIMAKMVILDCCRDNPLTRSWLTTRSTRSGMAEVKKESLPEATMIMFSTAPGKTALDGTGGNSPFTKALVANLTKPGTTAFDAFLGVSDAVALESSDTQIPWIKFDGAGRAFRQMSFAEGAQTSLPEIGSIPSNSSATWRKLTDDQVSRFAHLAPGSDSYFKATISVGKNITGICADIQTNAPLAALFQDKCKFEWVPLQPKFVTIGSSISDSDPNGGIFFAANQGTPDEMWQKSKTGRIYLPLKKGQPKPLFTTQSRGVSVNEIKPGADLESPSWFFSYSGEFEEADSLEAMRAGRIQKRPFKFTLFVFAKR